MVPADNAHEGAANGSHTLAVFAAASAGTVLLLVAAVMCMWFHRRRQSAPEEAANKEQLRKDLLHAHDSVVVARKRITGEDVNTAANYVSSLSGDKGGQCGNSSGGSAAAGRVPMVGFLDLPEEEQQRLRAGNINDSVLIMRNKRAAPDTDSSAAKNGEAAVAYYQQHLAQLQSRTDGSSNSGSTGEQREGAAAQMAEQLRGRCSDSSESGKHVQFGAAQVVATVLSSPSTSAAGNASVAGVAADVGAAAAAAAAPAAGIMLDDVQPEHAAAATTVVLPGGVDGDSISIDTAELAAGQRHSRGDDTARLEVTQLPGSAW